MKKRLFIGYKANKNLQTKIQKFKLNHYQKFPSAKWTPKENLHITLVPPNIIFDLNKAKKLFNLLKFKSFYLTFHQIKTAPKNPYSMIWVVAKNNPGLKRLKKEIKKIFGFEEKRSDNAHLTIARLKPPTMKNFQKNINWRFKIDKLYLFESFLDPKGAKYEIRDEKKSK